MGTGEHTERAVRQNDDTREKTRKRIKMMEELDKKSANDRSLVTYNYSYKKDGKDMYGIVRASSVGEAEKHVKDMGGTNIRVWQVKKG